MKKRSYRSARQVVQTLSNTLDFRWVSKLNTFRVICRLQFVETEFTDVSSTLVSSWSCPVRRLIALFECCLLSERFFIVLFPKWVQSGWIYTFFCSHVLDPYIFPIGSLLINSFSFPTLKIFVFSIARRLYFIIFSSSFIRWCWPIGVFAPKQLEKYVLPNLKLTRNSNPNFRCKRKDNVGSC